MEIEAVVNLFSNVGFPVGLLILAYWAGRGIWSKSKVWGDALLVKIMEWFEAQTHLVETLRSSLNETRTDIQQISKTQEILARQHVRTNRIFDRVVTVMENSKCVATDQLRQAKKDYDSDEFTESSEDSSTG